MRSTSHAVRWLAPISHVAPRVKWSRWHATDGSGRTLCGQPLSGRVHRAERAGTHHVGCARCRRALAA